MRKLCVLVALAAGCGGPDAAPQGRQTSGRPAGEKSVQQKGPAPGPPASVTADELGAAYEANEVAANLKYDGKLLEVTGHVLKVEGGARGRKPVVRLDANTRRVVVNVVCVFADADAPALAGLAAFHKATVRGVLHSRGAGELELRDCKLVASGPPD
jgi:hypothetical protein